MATVQTIQHFQQFAADLNGPVLEIGSLVDPSYKQHLPKHIHNTGIPEKYIGIDIFPGEGVDHVINLCKPEDLQKLPFQQFNTIHCHYVMEHVTDIFTMSQHIEKLLSFGGVLLFSVPFAWRIHRIPIDMWRFTPQSIDYLFPNIEFIHERSAISLRKGNKTYPMGEFPEFNFGKLLDTRPAYISWYVKAMRRLGLHNNIFNQRALLHESNIMMYGIKRQSPTYTYFDTQYL
jgi:SAM-dependent methyltransferase